MAETFEITAQAPSTVIGADGLVTAAMEVTFKTKPNGVLGRARIPLDKYTPDEVARVVAAQARNIEAVHEL